MKRGWRFWYRPRGEAVECPACRHPGLRLLDVLRMRRDRPGLPIVFLTGCEGCGLLFTNPLPAAEELARFYAAGGTWAARAAGRTDRLAAATRRQLARNRSLRAKSPSPKRRALLAALQPFLDVTNPPPSSRVLDVGCGDGKLLDSLQDLGWQTYGVEPSSDVAFLRHHRLDAPPEDASFDFTVAHHVLEHVVDPLAFLRRLRATLRPGGTLFVSVPRVDTLPVHGDFRYCINGRNHVVAFTESCLRGLLARAGFETIARLDEPDLDAALSETLPLRLRLVARRSDVDPTLPDAPLAAAIEALEAYARTRLDRREQLWRRLPVRFRAGLAEARR
jgi:SAM-dependent methyltransferase